MDIEIAKFLEKVFIKARRYLLTKGYEEDYIVKKNPAGDYSRAFDIRAEEIIINELSKEYPDYGVVSEEIGDISTNQSEHFFVIDPVDGSFNFIRRIGGVGCSIALFENFDKDLRNVFFAFVGNYITGEIIFAKKGSGAYKNYKKVHCNNVFSVSEAVAGINFDYDISKDREKILPMLKSFKKVRYIGAASIDLCNVAIGAYDAFVDMRNNLTAENFCAAQLIIKESGGIFTDGRGNEITTFSMDERFSIIGSATLELAKGIVRTLLT
jgi:myo-inositol-1(or 4)-monophosphatase